MIVPSLGNPQLFSTSGYGESFPRATKTNIRKNRRFVFDNLPTEYLMVQPLAESLAATRLNAAYHYFKEHTHKLILNDHVKSTSARQVERERLHNPEV